MNTSDSEDAVQAISLDELFQHLDAEPTQPSYGKVALVLTIISLFGSIAGYVSLIWLIVW